MQKKYAALSGQKRSFKLLLASFIGIVCIMLMSGILFIHQMVSVVEGNTMRSNEAVLEQLCLDIDARIKEVETLKNQIAFHPELSSLYDIQADYSVMERSNLIRFAMNMAQMTGLNDTIYDFYIYIENSSTILGPGRKTDPQTLYSRIYHYPNMEYSLWYAQYLKGTNAGRYHPAEWIYAGKEQVEIILYVQHLPISGKIEGQLAILVNAAPVRTILDSIRHSSGNHIYVLDAQDRLILTTDHSAGRTDAVVGHKESAGQTLAFEEERLYVSGVASQKTGWRYLIASSYQEMMSGVNAARHGAITVLAICLVVGIALSYLLAYRNYMPVKGLMALLSGENHAAYKNEYDYIRQSILDYRDNEKNLTDIINRQSEVVKANYLVRLLKGIRADNDNASLHFMNLKFPHEGFFVALIQIDNFDALTSRKNEKEWALARFVVGNILDECLEGEWVYHSIELDKDAIGVLVNADHFDDRLAQVFDALIQTLELELHIRVSIGLSMLHHRKEHIPICYNEAVNALDFKIIRGEGRLICFGDVLAADEAFYFPPEAGMELLALTRAADYKGIEALLNDIFTVNLKSRRLSLAMGKCLYFSVASAVINLVNSLHIDYATVFASREDPLGALFECTSIEGMQSLVLSYYRNTCAYIQSMQSNSRDRIVQEAMRIIEEEYANCMLGLHFLAEKTGVTPQYLSSTFKRHTRENISEYIAKVRIAACKRLLSDTALPLNDIAERVGYANANVLIRIFRKYEGITPGKYRDIMPDSIKS